MNLKCDFCSTQAVRWRYPARTFERVTRLPDAEITAHSEGDWAACDPCHKLIQRGDRDGLARRSLDKLATPVPRSMKKDVLRRLREFQDDFWRNREGAPTEVTP